MRLASWVGHSHVARGKHSVGERMEDGAVVGVEVNHVRRVDSAAAPPIRRAPLHVNPPCPPPTPCRPTSV
ncbi:hypothetical protein NL676_022846 [Syzygium grande]|nr:hypothetical protein NL676_022846 [Syzygium grande]